MACWICFKYLFYDLFWVHIIVFHPHFCVWNFWNINSILRWLSLLDIKEPNLDVMIEWFLFICSPFFLLNLFGILTNCEWCVIIFVCLYIIFIVWRFGCRICSSHAYVLIFIFHLFIVRITFIFFFMYLYVFFKNKIPDMINIVCLMNSARGC